MAKKYQKRARAHHVVPQFYLRQWANSDDAVTMLTREGREVTTGTQALAVENDFYTVTTPDGAKDSSVEEGLLRDWDGRGADIHQRLLTDDFPLDHDARVKFGLFLSLQWLRGRAARQTGEEAHDLMHKTLITVGLDLGSAGEPEQDEPVAGGCRPPVADGPNINIPPLGHLSEDDKAALRDTDSYSFEVPREQLIMQMVKGVPEAAEIFLDADWILMRLEGGSLLTSDEPISLFRRPTSENQLLGLGPGNADLMQFPLSPTRCLLIRRIGATGRDELGDMPARAASDMNELTLTGSWRYLFRHPGSPPFPPVQPLPERRIEVV